ncbi:MAG: carbon-nitrogen hydrolase family protein [Planctomycetaceae bacterium]
MRIAGFQMDVKFADVSGNLDRMEQAMRSAVQPVTGAGAKLVIFPECSATGYCFTSIDECRQVAESMDGPICQRMVDVCRELDVYSVFGMIESDGDRLFNVAVLAGPTGVVGSYRKVHLPYLGLDMFTTPGDEPFMVHEIEGVRIGLNICYDSAFPESSRMLALQGADLIVLPTNWPPGAECLARTAIATRAMENGIYYAAINRVGEERGFRFIGRSSICAPNGDAMSESTGNAAEVLWADIDPERSRNKHFVRVPGKHEIDRFADRRPEMYGAIVAPHQFRTPKQRACRD